MCRGTKSAGALVLLATIGVASVAPAAAARPSRWVRPAVDYLDRRHYFDEDQFEGNRTMSRSRFRSLMRKAFGGAHLKRTKGRVTAGEVSRALVKALERNHIARTLRRARSPNGWRPSKPKYFGTEIVARELGLRHDRPVSQEDYEASATEPMRQADIAWAVWRAKTRPALYSADALAGFKLSNYGPSKRAMVNFALSLVGKPYVWAGEWTKRTGRRYPYGAQEHGGFDCSGFIWYVLKKKNSVYRPIDRHYEGWKIGQRSAADMAAATRRRISYRKLRPGDIVFFAPRGRKSRARTVYHAGIYLGRGWMVHSSASRAGVSLADISRNSWWHGQIAWGRRVI